MRLRNASNGTYSVVALAMTKGDLPGRVEMPADAEAGCAHCRHEVRGAVERGERAASHHPQHEATIG